MISSLFVTFEGNYDVDLKPDFTANVENVQTRQFSLGQIKASKKFTSRTDEIFRFCTKYLFIKVTKIIDLGSI